MAKNNKKRFFYVLYSDKTRVFDQSERTYYPIYNIMHDICIMLLFHDGCITLLHDRYITLLLHGSCIIFALLLHYCYMIVALHYYSIMLQ